MKYPYCFCCLLILIAFSAQAQNHKTLADNYYALGNYSKAIQHLNQLPESKAQQLKLAKSYQQTGNLKQALTYYKSIFNTNPEDQFVAFEYAKLLIKTANNSQASEILLSLMKIDSLNPNFPYQLGLLKEKTKDSLALHYFEKAYQLDTNFIPATLKIAAEKIRTRNFNHASTLLNKIIAIDDTHYKAWNLKALNHFYQEDFHKAIESFQKLLELNRPSENVYQKLGYCYARTMRHQKAIDHYTIAINEYDDKNPQTHYEIAQAYRALYYLDKAERHFEIAMLLKEPQLENEYLGLYSVYTRQKNFKKAFDIIKEASEKYPENQVFTYRLAVAADNYFKDKNSVLKLYENYIKKFGETGRYRLLVEQRIKDIKKEVHLNSN